MLQVDALRDTPSSYLDSNKDAFLPEALSVQTRRTHRPRREAIDAGDARIITNRPISREERSALEAIAEVIRQLLSK